MLRYFPVAYEDELLFSQIARYHIHSCSPGYKQTIQELFGSRTVAAVVDLPAHLRQFHKHVHHIIGKTVDEILYGQTLYPVFSPFLGPKLAKLVKESMLSDYGGDIHTRAGIAASSVKRNARLKICPECYHSQIERYGEACWQRHFQVSGVLVCPVHRRQLQETETSYVPANKHQFTAPPLWGPVADELNITSTHINKLCLIARDVKSLLSETYSPLTHSQWTKKYWSLLHNKQLTKGKFVKQAKLHQAFVDFWGKNSLNLLSCRVEADNDHSWLSAIARKHRKNFHPIRHLLFYRFLVGAEGSISEFFSKPKQHTKTAIYQYNRQASRFDPEKNKRQWLQLQKDHPGLFAKQLRQLAPALYARLFRQDDEWLKANTPHQIHRETINQRVNWQQRDRSLALSILRQYHYHRKRDDYPRLSKKKLAQSAGCLSAVEKHLEHLPVTKQVLEKYSESVADYQCRRIDNAVATLQQTGELVLPWKVYRKANIRADVSIEIKQYLQKKTDESVKSPKIQTSSARNPATDLPG